MTLGLLASLGGHGAWGMGLQGGESWFHQVEAGKLGVCPDLGLHS